ncbi:MAG: carboxymuconolactone decarboxylase family protein [Betaproteobacteria bacterium]|nr:carboxymuconolactone decarboxylase family protein [Betaproteobacteria bacterium]
MSRRLDYRTASPEALKTYRCLESYVRGCGLEPKLLELVRSRVSQINGCGYCLDMHTKDARAAGEDEQRLYLLSAWRDAPCYSERERAALAWAEALTTISQGDVSDALYEQARRHFDEKQLVDLTLAVIAINGWNRIAIAFRTPVGSYQPPRA